ncbi:hypothetical protein ACWEQJ_29670, partial [Streptomyces cyaneofuscatus]
LPLVHPPHEGPEGVGGPRPPVGLYLLAPVVKRELNNFLEYVRVRKAGGGDGDDGGKDDKSAKVTV